MRELERSQYGDPSRMRENQFKSFKAMLLHAYENTAYYREVFERHNINPEGIKCPDDVKAIPILTKKHVQEHGQELIARQYRSADLVPFKTGGSTGKSVTVFWDFAAAERGAGSGYRAFKWAGWEIGEPWGRVWGNPPACGSAKEKILNTLINPQIFLDTMNLNEETVRDFAKRWKGAKPTLLHGHSHSLYILAQFCKALNIDYIQPKGIISTSMMLMASEREIIESVFGCKVTDLYGCEEVGLIASECEKHEGMHINIDCNYVEFVDAQSRPVEWGEDGAVLVTNLINKAMPLIRYKIEDMGIASRRTCPCGRTLPLMEEVTGRVADFLVRKDGSLVAGVSLIERTLTATPGIYQMQIIQEDLGSLILNIVRSDSYNEKTEHYLKKEFSETFGPDLNVKLNFVDNINQDQNGKYRFSISKVKNIFQL